MDNNLFEQKGKLSLILGKGYLTSYEANNLKKDDIIIISDRLVGDPASLYFNNNLLKHCNILIIDDIFCAIPLKGDFSTNESKINGVSDDIVEILPFEVKIAEIDISLKNLFDVNFSTIIAFSKYVDEKEDAELIVAGIPIAYGKVAFVDYINESYALKITNVCNTKKEKISIRTSESIIEKTLAKRVMNYDFKRPDKFSLEHINKIKKLSETLVRNIQLLIPEFKDYKLIDVLQLTYEEAQSMAKGYSSLIIKNTRRRLFDAMNTEDYNKKPFLEEENAKIRISKEKIEMIKKSALFKEILPLENIQICYTKDSFISKLFKNDDSIKEFILTPLRSVWKKYIDTNLGIENKNDNINEHQIEYSLEITLTVIIGKENNLQEKMIMIYPYIYLEPILSLFAD